MYSWTASCFSLLFQREGSFSHYLMRFWLKYTFCEQNTSCSNHGCIYYVLKSFVVVGVGAHKTFVHYMCVHILFLTEYIILLLPLGLLFSVWQAD